MHYIAFGAVSVINWASK